jgi:hypothetical protein
MEGKERNRLNGRFANRNPQPREPQHREEAENQNRPCQVEMRRVRLPNRSTLQHQRSAKHSNECPHDPVFPHV